MALLEIACFRPEDASTAYKAGADRIELCDDREAGGVTPPRSWLAKVKSAVQIPVFVMIRPRGGGFCYSEPEFDRMKHDIDHFRDHADGLVFGVLGSDGRVDVRRTAELVQRADPLPCTFHRAFDDTPNLLEALEDVISTGCHAILTSGGGASVLAGIEKLAQLTRVSRGRITIIPGGGVRSENISALKLATRATVFHSSGIVRGSNEPSHAEVQWMKASLSDEGPDAETHVGVMSQDVDSSEELLAMAAVSVGDLTAKTEFGLC